MLGQSLISSSSTSTDCDSILADLNPVQVYRNNIADCSYVDSLYGWSTVPVVEWGSSEAQNLHQRSHRKLGERWGRTSRSGTAAYEPWGISTDWYVSLIFLRTGCFYCSVSSFLLFVGSRRLFLQARNNQTRLNGASNGGLVRREWSEATYPGCMLGTGANPPSLALRVRFEVPMTHGIVIGLLDDLAEQPPVGND